MSRLLNHRINHINYKLLFREGQGVKTRKARDQKARARGQGQGVKARGQGKGSRQGVKARGQGKQYIVIEATLFRHEPVNNSV